MRVIELINQLKSFSLMSEVKIQILGSESEVDIYKVEHYPLLKMVVLK